MNIEQTKIIVKENTVEFLNGAFGDYRKRAKRTIINAAHEIAYHELCNDWMNGDISSDEVSEMAQEIAEELAAGCRAN